MHVGIYEIVLGQDLYYSLDILFLRIKLLFTSVSTDITVNSDRNRLIHYATCMRLKSWLSRLWNEEFIHLP